MRQQLFTHTQIHYQKLVAVGQESSSTSLPPPYILTFPKSMFKSLQQDDDDSEEATTSVSRGAKRRMNGETTISASPQTVDAILVRSYKMPNMGPYPEDVPKKNNVRFTPAQGKVRSGFGGCLSG